MVLILIDNEIACAYIERALHDLDVIARSQDALVEHQR
jgi:hypothetical protein